MSQQLLFLNTKSLSHTLALNIPDKCDHWEIDGKRVNFHIRKINNPEHPDLLDFVLFFGYSVFIMFGGN